MKKLLLIFDLDGTLADTKEDLCRSVNHVRTRFGRSPLSGEAITGMIGNGARELIRRALDDAAPTAVDAGLELFLAYYRDHMLDETRLYEGVEATLAALADRGHAMAVLTNKPFAFSRRMLADLGIGGYFASVYGGNSFSRKKPDPVGVFRILADTGASPEDTWMVGDSSVDVLTGRNAGVRTCGVTYGYAPHSFAVHPPDRLVDVFSELPGVVA